MLKKNGFFVVLETPTIYFPRNSHCGWFYDWLPFSVSFTLLKRKLLLEKRKLLPDKDYKDFIFKYTSDTEILNSGACFRGVSISEITPEKEKFEIVKLPESIIKLEILYPLCKPIKELSKIRKFVFIFVKVLKIFIPTYYLLPQYNLVIRKL